MRIIIEGLKSHQGLRTSATTRTGPTRQLPPPWSTIGQKVTAGTVTVN